MSPVADVERAQAAGVVAELAEVIVAAAAVVVAVAVVAAAASLQPLFFAIAGGILAVLEHCSVDLASSVSSATSAGPWIPLAPYVPYVAAEACPFVAFVVVFEHMRSSR